jgi:hypothetical protein
MPVSDITLQEKLRCFTKRIAGSLTFDDCLRLFESPDGGYSVEYEGEDTQDDFLTYMSEILDIEEVESQRCARLSTHVCDNRPAGLGSVYTPLCSGAWLFQDGHIEYFPLGNLAAERDEIAF